MIEPKDGIEGKKWPAKGERAAIKALKPYNGGDDTLWPLHRLDILPKPERLLSTTPDVKGFLRIGRYTRVGGTKAIKRLENKTVLFQLPPGEILNATQGNTLLAPFITFWEPSVGLDDQEKSQFCASSRLALTRSSGSSVRHSESTKAHDSGWQINQ
jgi:hypothetical protein